MHISDFLLIDALLAILVIPILLFFQDRNKKLSIFRALNKTELLEKTSINLPDKEKLLYLEKFAISQGSGIEFDSLLGEWKFQSVWIKDYEKEDSIFSLLLRIFSAKLDLKKAISIDDQNEFCISISIQFGLLSIGFSGSAYLRGQRPTLTFFLNLIELKSGSRILLSKSLEEPSKNEKTFFAFIAAGESGEWLSARSQRGAFILWLKN